MRYPIVHLLKINMNTIETRSVKYKLNLRPYNLPKGNILKYIKYVKWYHFDIYLDKVVIQSVIYNKANTVSFNFPHLVPS